MDANTLARAMVAATKLAACFPKHGFTNISVATEKHRSSEKPFLKTDQGNFVLEEPHRRRSGTWVVSSIERPLADVEVYLPSKKDVDVGIETAIATLVRRWREEGAKDAEQARRKKIADQIKSQLDGSGIEVALGRFYMDHLRGDGIGTNCVFTIKVKIDEGEEIAAKLVAALSHTPPTS